MNENIEFTTLSDPCLYSRFYEEKERGAYVAYIRGKRCATEEGFFKEISAAFQFPYYFGENWPALDECITDLDWLKIENRIFLSIDNFGAFFENNKEMQELLLRHIEFYISEWRNRNVYFKVLLSF